MLIRFTQTGTSADALNGRKYSKNDFFAALTLFAACETSGDSLGFSVGSTEIIVAGTVVNVRAGANILDTDRDQLLFRERVGGGQYFMPMTMTTSMIAMLVIEPLQVQ